MSGSFTDELINFIAMGLYECIALAMLTLALLRLKYEWKKIFIVGTGMSFLVLFFRLLLLDTGIHTAMATLAMALLVANLFKVSRLSSLIAALISMLYLFLCELLVFKFYKNVLLVDINSINKNRLYCILSYWPQILLIVAAAFLITKTNWYRQGVNPEQSIKKTEAR